MLPIHIPAQLRWLEHEPGGREWLHELPGRIDAVSRRWQLQIGEPFPNSNVSYVAPAFRASGQVVLKIQWPHRESLGEAEALRRWNGDGAVYLLDEWAEQHALLIELCQPGRTLSQAQRVDRLEIAIGLLRRLMKPGDRRFTSLAEEARLWADNLYANWISDGKRCEKRLVDAALAFFQQLAPGASEGVLLHQDLHGDNILSAQREPWLVIDPKPLSGDPNFAAAPLIRGFELGHSRASVLNRMARLCTELELDRGRVLGWTVLQTIAWSFGSRYAAAHCETVRWLLSAAAT